MPSPAAGGAPPGPSDSYYPYTNSFPPPPGATPVNPPQMSYNPSEYPPPPGAVPPPQPHGYPPPPGPPPGTEPYAPQPRRADENVSAPFIDAHHRPDGGFGVSIGLFLAANEHSPGLRDFSAQRRARSASSEMYSDFRRRSMSQPPPPSQSKSVAFNLHEQPPSASNVHDRPGRNADQDYETDDSDSTIDGTEQRRHRHRHRHRRSSVPDSRRSANPPPSASHTRAPKPGPRDAASDSDSESTVDLPDRFDADGHRLPEKGDDPIADTLEGLLQSVFSEGKSKSRSRSKVF